MTRRSDFDAGRPKGRGGDGRLSRKLSLAREGSRGRHGGWLGQLTGLLETLKIGSSRPEIVFSIHPFG